MTMIDVEKALAELTLDEKLRMLEGKDFWHTMDYPAKGIPSIEVADGPYGLRKQKGLCDHLGWNVSEKATAYPSGPSVAATFDRHLVCELGKHLAAEARSQDVDVLLGPAVNMVRTPLCGRNFEYYSEDPCLAGEIAASYVSGVQSQGVGTCIKHFAANNQEVEREFIDAEVSERALREIYLKVFETAVSKSHPWSIMTALNKVNGDYCSENRVLLCDVLRGEWGFDGLAMSDWSGVNNRVKALKSGLDLEMPYSWGISQERLRLAYDAGELSMEDIDAGVRNILNLVNRVLEGRKVHPDYSDADHNAFSCEIAEKSAVLLKNESSILPLKRNARIAVIGDMAIHPRFKMEGSALVNPSYSAIPLDEIKAISEGEVYFASGYDENSELDDEGLAEAVSLASDSDVVVIFAGLPGGIEAEGKDRKDMMMPASHVRLIHEVSNANGNVVVVLSNGSPVDTSWDGSVKAVLEMFLGGQMMGRAVARLLFGLATPGGKLPVSFPYRLEQNPSYLNYPGHMGVVTYSEDVFIGYRYYVTKGIDVKYPFGFGLSYTDFEISISDFRFGSVQVSLRVKVRNVGSMNGSETVQIYVAPPTGRIPRPRVELRDFARVYLCPGQECEVSFSLDTDAFSYFDEDLKDWYMAPGEYGVIVATSSRDLVDERKVMLSPKRLKHDEITGWSTIGALRATPAGAAAIERIKDTLSRSSSESARNFPIFRKNGETQDDVDRIPLRMITVLTDNSINNDIMDSIIEDANRMNLEVLG